MTKIWRVHLRRDTGPEPKNATFDIETARRIEAEVIAIRQASREEPVGLWRCVGASLKGDTRVQVSTLKPGDIVDVGDGIAISLETCHAVDGHPSHWRVEGEDANGTIRSLLINGDTQVEKVR